MIANIYHDLTDCNPKMDNIICSSKSIYPIDLPYKYVNNITLKPKNHKYKNKYKKYCL